MKLKFQMYAQSFAILLISTLLCSLIFALLYNFNVISTKVFHICNWLFGIIAYGAGGFWLGKKVEKKALLNAFVMILILAIPALMLASPNMLGWLKCASKLATYMIVCMYIFSKRKL